MKDTYCKLCGKLIKNKSSLIQVKAKPEDRLIDVCVKHYSESDFWERIEYVDTRKR